MYTFFLQWTCINFMRICVHVGMCRRYFVYTDGAAKRNYIMLHQHFASHLNYHFASLAVCACAGDRLYIIMELIEGATLGEHFTSLKEKRESFTEEKIWHIFFQVRATHNSFR